MAFVDSKENIRNDDLGGFTQDPKPAIEELAKLVETEYLKKSKIEEKFLTIENSKKAFLSFDQIEELFIQKITLSDAVADLQSQIDRLSDSIKELTPKL